VLAILSELAELLDEVNFKWWKNPKALDHAALKEELVDILHFFMSMCWRAGMDADELFRIYTEKNRENFDRQLGRSQKKGYALEEKPVTLAIREVADGKLTASVKEEYLK